MFIRITKDKGDDTGYRIQLTDGINRTACMLQSRRYQLASEARYDARRLFGPLEWLEPLPAGCQLDFVIAVSQVIVLPAGPFRPQTGGAIVCRSAPPDPKP